MNRFARMIAMPFGLLTTLVLASAVCAQEEPYIRNIAAPAEKYAITPGGVDIRTGRYAYDQTDLSIGDGRGLSFKRILSTSIGGHIDPFANFSHNWDITITEKLIPTVSGTFSMRPNLQDPDQLELSVNFDGRSETFRGPTYAAESAQVSKSMWARLTSVGDRGSAGVIYTFQASGGTRVIFRPLGTRGAGDCTGLSWVRCAYASQVVHADGTTYNLEYDTNSSGLSRLRSVVSNRGYALLLEYSGAGASWSSVTKACVLNLTTVAKPSNSVCPANAASTTSYTYTTFDYREKLASATDAIGGVSSFAYAADLEGAHTLSFTKPGQSSPWQIALIYPYINADDTWDQIVYRQDFSDGSSYAYGYDSTQPGPGQRAGIAGGSYTDALGNYTQVRFGFPALPKPPPPPPPYVPPQIDDAIYQVTAGPVQVIDPLGRTTTSDYCDPSTNLHGRCAVLPLQSITNMEGDKTNLVYSNSTPGLIIRSERTPKPGSPLSMISESITDNPNCINNLALCDKPLTTTDPKGNVTNYTYDPVHGGVLTVTLPAPTAGAVRPQKRYSYQQLYAWYKNSAGTVVQASSPVWMLTAISECRTVVSCAGTPDETLTTISYGAPSTPNNLFVTSVTVAAGDGSISATTAKTYDVQGNELTVDGPLPGTADTARTRYDGLRRVVGTITPDPDGAGPLPNRAVRNTYNPAGDLIRVEKGTVPSQSDSDWTQFSSYQAVDTVYDTLGKKMKETVSAGGIAKAVTQYSYDLARRIVCTAARMDPAQWSTQTDACVPQTTGPNGPDRISKLVYNEAGEVVKKQVAVGTADQADDESYTYTPNGMTATVTDGENNRTTFEYDGFDRLEKTRYPVTTQGALASSATDFEKLTYDPNSNVTLRQLRDGQLIGSTYDNLNRARLKDLPAPEVDVTYDYDLQNHVATVTQGSAVVTHGYDALGRTQYETSSQGTMAYQYDEAGRRKRTSWPDGFFVTQDFLTTGEVLAIRESNAASGVGVLATYGYDTLGRRSSITRGNGTITYITYDSISRLQSLRQDLSGTAQDVVSSFSYNPASQLVTWSRNNNAYAWTGHFNVNRPYSVNGLNQLTTAGTTALGYDGRGNLTSQGSSAYGYTSENRLISGPNGAVFSYDATGRLSQSSGSSGTTRYQYDGTDLVAEYNASNQLQRRYVHGPGDDEPLVWYEGSGTTDRRWFHQDERGSTIAVSNSAGTTLTINSYDEYGIPASNNLGRFQYTGQTWMPDIGMYYYKARVYSPTLGRFLQTDSIGYKDGINWYAYVANNPIGGTDSTGTVCYLCLQERTQGADGRVTIRSNEILRAVIPGQVAWDNALTSSANGDKWGAAAGTASMVGQQLLAVATIGQSAAVTQGAAATTSAAESAINAASAAGKAATASGVVKTSGAAATGLITTEGAVITGASTGAGGSGATNAVVKSLVDAVPDLMRRPTTGCCGEIDALSKALNAGANVTGATMATIRIKTGAVMDACPACQWIADQLGVITVPK